MIITPKIILTIGISILPFFMDSLYREIHYIVNMMIVSEKNLLGLAIIGGFGPKPETLKDIVRCADLLVAADSGLIAAEEAGLTPDWVVGDMDSLNAASTGSAASQGGLRRLEKYPPERVICYPCDKDSSDTELAIALLREKGCGEIWLSGGGGGRTDHLLALHALFERENPPKRWFTGTEEIRCLMEGKVLSATLPPGSLVSVFPLREGPWQAESSGLKWPLNGLSWETDGPAAGAFSLSNTVENDPFEIRSQRGRFLVILPNTPD
jgi:thiamine pyrophosphokinase